MKKITLLLLISLNLGLMGCSKNIPDSEELNAEKQLINQSIEIDSDTQPVATNQQQCQPKESMYYNLESTRSCFYIKNNCPEGEVSCQDVDLFIVDKITKKQIQGKGKVISANQSYRFLGYEFYVGDQLYEFALDSMPDKLRIWNKDRTELLHEENLKDKDIDSE